MRGRKRLALAGTTGLLVLMLAVLVFSGVAIAITHGASMQPTFYEGDIGFLSLNFNPDDLKVGDIIAFHIGSSQTITCHRIIAIENDSNGNRLFITQGDNEELRDKGYRSEGDIVGVLMLVVPFYLVFFIIIAICVFFVLMTSVFCLKRRRK